MTTNNAKQDTLLRQWTMLRHVPRYPRKVSAPELQQKLTDAGYRTDLRTVQRDLIKLSAELPLVSDDAKPRGWSWQMDAAPLDIPTLDPQSALTFRLAEDYLRALLPVSTLNYLQPWFRAAKGVLDATSANGMVRWPEKIRVLAPGQPLLPPQIDPSVQAVLYDALLREKRVAVTYLPKEGKEIKDYVVSPLALVVRDRVAYLLATLRDYQNVMQLVLHRVHSAELLDEPVISPTDFNLDEYIASGGFGFIQSEQTLQLLAEFRNGSAQHLSERPLSADQALTNLGDGRALLRATVCDTSELRWWLRAFGDNVTILSPEALRIEFVLMARQLAEQYDVVARHA